jgi:hypothetical protein
MRRARVETPAGGWFEPWPLVFELVGGATLRVVLIGGLMTELHSLIAGVSDFRPTDDVDLLVNMMDPSSTPASWHGRLVGANFELQMPNARGGPSYRYKRGEQIVDLMVPDHTPPVPRLAGRSAMEVTGGRQALLKLMEVEFEFDGRQIVTELPDQLGALILKAAAHKVDPRDKPRHLRDAALLASLIEQPNVDRNRLVGSDRQRIRYIAEKLRDPFVEAWQLLPPLRQQMGQDALRILTE